MDWLGIAVIVGFSVPIVWIGWKIDRNLRWCINASHEARRAELEIEK